MEAVIRVRGATRDANDEPVAGSSTPLQAVAVAPGASTRNQARGRNGSKIAYTVYFWPSVDLRDDDKLRVRNTLCEILVGEWVSPRTGRRGQEVLCSSGKG